MPRPFLSDDLSKVRPHAASRRRRKRPRPSAAETIFRASFILSPISRAASFQRLGLPYVQNPSRSPKRATAVSGHWQINLPSLRIGTAWLPRQSRGVFSSAAKNSSMVIRLTVIRRRKFWSRGSICAQLRSTTQDAPTVAHRSAQARRKRAAGARCRPAAAAQRR